MAVNAVPGDKAGCLKYHVESIQCGYKLKPAFIKQ